MYGAFTAILKDEQAGVSSELWGGKVGLAGIFSLLGWVAGLLELGWLGWDYLLLGGGTGNWDWTGMEREGKGECIAMRGIFVISCSDLLSISSTPARTACLLVLNRADGSVFDYFFVRFAPSHPFVRVTVRNVAGCPGFRFRPGLSLSLSSLLSCKYFFFRDIHFYSLFALSLSCFKLVVG